MVQIMTQNRDTVGILFHQPLHQHDFLSLTHTATFSVIRVWQNLPPLYFPQQLSHSGKICHRMTSESRVRGCQARRTRWGFSTRRLSTWQSFSSCEPHIKSFSLIYWSIKRLKTWSFEKTIRSAKVCTPPFRLKGISFIDILPKHPLIISIFQ